MFSIIVSTKALSSCQECMEDGHEWSVEGDYGFLGSFKTEGEAWRHAQAEAALVNENRITSFVGVTLNA